jgi:hypothetical protein
MLYDERSRSWVEEGVDGRRKVVYGRSRMEFLDRVRELDKSAYLKSVIEVLP